MEPLISPPKRSICPLICIFRASALVLLTLFVLYMPLGDPYTECYKDKATYDQKLAVCCLCDMYLASAKVASKTMELSQFVFYTTSDILYETKLKLYSLLGRIDGNDLCRTVCCSDSLTELDKKRGRNCRCSRKCSKTSL